MDTDMNNYDLEHVCTGHPLMSAEVWRGSIATPGSATTPTSMSRPCCAGRGRADQSAQDHRCDDGLLRLVRIERVHPLQFGFLRRKIRTSRRQGLALENPLLFYPRRAIESAVVLLQWLKLVRRYRRIMAEVLADSAGTAYTDHALARLTGGPETDELVKAFADKIPDTYGAPVRPVAAVPA